MAAANLHASVPRARSNGLEARYESRREALDALDAYRRKEAARLRVLAECPPGQMVKEASRIRATNPADVLAEIPTYALAAVVDPFAFKHPSRNGMRVEVSSLDPTDDRSREDAAIRARLAAGKNYGPVEEWATIVDIDGAIQTRIFRGPLSAFHVLVPDAMTFERIRQVGAVGLEMTGRPFQVERLGAPVGTWPAEPAPF
jgi:hypothetical protein